MFIMRESEDSGPLFVMYTSSLDCILSDPFQRKPSQIIMSQLKNIYFPPSHH